MNAARALERAGLDTDEVRLALHPIRPADVNLYPASAFLRSVWGEGISGITLWRWVLVDPGLLHGDPQRLGRLVLHELVHLRQFSELGLGRFALRYGADYLRGRRRGLGHREAYRQISLETDARQATAQLAGPTLI